MNGKGAGSRIAKDNCPHLFFRMGKTAEIHFRRFHRNCSGGRTVLGNILNARQYPEIKPLHLRIVYRIAYGHHTVVRIQQEGLEGHLTGETVPAVQPVCKVEAYRIGKGVTTENVAQLVHVFGMEIKQECGFSFHETGRSA